jgi:hypothetical protein
MKAHSAHKNFILEELTKSHSEKEWEALFLFNTHQIQNFQHERFIHLIVTLTIGLSLLLTVYFMIAYNLFVLYPIAGLLFALFIPYIFHYFRLENGTQSLYPLSQKILEKILQKH